MSVHRGSCRENLSALRKPRSEESNLDLLNLICDQNFRTVENTASGHQEPLFSAAIGGGRPRSEAGTLSLLSVEPAWHMMDNQWKALDIGR